MIVAGLRLHPAAVLAVMVALIALSAGADGAQGRATHTAGRSENYPTIYVEYSAQCTFTIINLQLERITEIPPGTYQVEVETPGPFGIADRPGESRGGDTDCGGFAQFQLAGPGVNLATTLDVGFQGATTLPATYFAPDSTFVALDNDNPSGTRTVLTTAASAPPLTPAGSPFQTGCNPDQSCPAQFVESGNGLGAVLTQGGGVELLAASGRPAANVTQGYDVIAVKDKDAKASLYIQKHGSPPIRLTPPNFIGHKRFIRVLVTPGTWMFYATPHGTKQSFTVVG